MDLVKYTLANLFVIGLVSGHSLTLDYDPKNRIVGGFETSIEKNPWQVSLLSSDWHTCGGSIISANYVLTAAHCTSGYSVAQDADFPRIRFRGEYSVRVGSSSKGSGGSIIKVKRVIRHKDYSDYTLDFDFSLLELATKLSFSVKIQPIALPDADISIKDGEISLVSGWGATQNSTESNKMLRAVYVPIINQQTCNKAYNGKITDRMICAGYEQGDSGFGDSGGPLSLKRNGVWILVGTVSWGAGCAQPNYPGVYGRVSSVRSWIKNETGI
ncbi:trypsin-4-like [Contarinia nasturtii]|uniref:trypsin-4-like n=1 Tax=Contarinia nasturtii TaxID=265458 RepID=UPI0012D38781|nr:trypsin-4-like [Contarinia nasturtii]